MHTYIISALILSSPLCLCILGGNFPSGFLTDIFTSGNIHTPLTATLLIWSPLQHLAKRTHYDVHCLLTCNSQQLAKANFSEYIFIIIFVTQHFLQEISFSYFQHTLPIVQTKPFLLSPPLFSHCGFLRCETVQSGWGMWTLQKYTLPPN
jgi:hypothetical protein